MRGSFCSGIIAVVLACVLLSATPAAALTGNQAYVNQVYLDLLNRPADPSSLATFSSALDTSALTRFDFAADVTSSSEFLGDEVSQFYLHLLGRAPLPIESTSGVSLLQTTTGTFEQLQGAIAGADEFFALNGSTNNGFISAAFQDFLNRSPNSLELAGFNNQLSGSFTRSDVAGEILVSTEYRQDLVNSYYLWLVHRSADPTGLNTFVSALGSGQKDQFVIDSLIASDEYYNNAVPEPASALPLFPALAMLARARRVTR